ncbi:MAG: hybrid sensor histidine kinase/response regulator, partial [Gemmatimonadetes bacterium]|nr:hybrid sensor histidine kinase/response regulator [Gemmatimonadota bacterium]
FAIINDISERREAERSLSALGDQLAQSQRLESIGRLAGGIAHDFNNILTTILSSVTFLEDAPLNDEQRTDLREIGRAAERASQLTNQLLAFARKRVIKPRSMDIGQTIRDQARFLRRVIGEESTLELRIADGLWP